MLDIIVLFLLHWLVIPCLLFSFFLSFLWFSFYIFTGGRMVLEREGMFGIVDN